MSEKKNIKLALVVDDGKEHVYDIICVEPVEPVALKGVYYIQVDHDIPELNHGAGKPLSPEVFKAMFVLASTVHMMTDDELMSHLSSLRHKASKH